MKNRRMCKVEQLSLDIISTIPQAILEIILCLLPTEEAARTSILSREWRYKWTKIPKLEFKHFRPCTQFYAIQQVLLMRQGPIHELGFQICGACDHVELDQIILHLAKNHKVKKLTLTMDDWGAFDSSFHLPISVFSLQHLTDLDLFCAGLDHQPIFTVFGSLRSLRLDHVWISKKNLLHLLSNCPLLKSLTLHRGHVDRHCTTTELFKCLPVIEHLTTSTFVFKWLVLDLVSKELPALPNLKYFCFEDMCYVGARGLAFLFLLIKCSPNLEKIKLEIDFDHFDHDADDACDEEHSVVVWEEYLDVRLEHLNELEIEGFSNSKDEMEFVKLIMAKSPNLKKVKFTRSGNFTHTMDTMKEKMKILEDLLWAPRASAVRILFKS